MVPVRRALATRFDDLQRDRLGAAARVHDRDLQRLTRVEPADHDLESASLERRELEQITDKTKQLLARRLDLTKRLLLLIGDRAGEPFLHEGDVADDGRERRTQLVGDVREKLVLDAPCLQ